MCLTTRVCHHSPTRARLTVAGKRKRISQCNNKLILRITNPYDLDHIGKSAEGIDKQSQNMLTSLRVGEALLVGEATGYPVFFKVRQRNSQPSRHEIPLEKAALDFEKGREEKDAETRELL